MKNFFLLIALSFFFVPADAQDRSSYDYEKAFKALPMEWICPGIEKYQGILSSKKNEDVKLWADAIKEDFQPYTDPSNGKHLLTQTVFTVENPLYDTNNLIDYISSWLKKEGWGSNLKVDKENKTFSSFIKEKHIASHADFLHVYKVYISPYIEIHLLDDNQLSIAFLASDYTNKEYGSDNRLITTYNKKIGEVYPFVPKSTHKNTYAKAYVSTYIDFWNTISKLRSDLNLNFSKDTKFLQQKHYEYSVDSLASKYGEVTKVIFDETQPNDVTKQIRIYEDAKKAVVLGQTIDFKDLMSCEITDDPKYAPGRSYSVGGGISIFGFGLGGSQTINEPGKVIHNYLVNIKLDNLKTPLILILTGRNEAKAQEILACFEYILRHHATASRPKSKQVRR